MPYGVLIYEMSSLVKVNACIFFSCARCKWADAWDNKNQFALIILEAQYLS